ncbi:MAG: 3-dehydroquinate dehydratase II [Bacteroidetes bacterium]|nr:MAG: 3-dehydroquinate dehydratase II [Bacteroidota bacterium]
MKLIIRLFLHKSIAMKILIINGPNLNLLGKRQVEIYGNQSFEDYYNFLKIQFKTIDLEFFQSNHEGELIDKLHFSNHHFDAVVMNPGAFAHTSIALADAIKSIAIPVVEVHISNIHARESYRRNSLTAEACRGIISGFGMESYRLAIEFFQQK